MKIRDLHKSERPREKLIAKGVENLKDAELLAILLRTGSEKKDVLETAKSILESKPKTQLLTLTYKDLVQIDGIESAKACTLLAAFEITKRALKVNNQSLPTINEPKDVVAYISDIRQHKKEHFVVIYLNARNQVIHKETISVGTLNVSLVHPREVFEPALKHLAAQVVLAHNHPSGDPQPSDADLEITKRLKEAGKLLGIEVIDHVIITQSAFYSFSSSHLL